MSTAAQGPATASATPILDRLIPLPQSPAKAKSGRLSLASAIFLVVLPLLCIGLMVWSPSFLQLFEAIAEPCQRFLDRTVDQMFSGNFQGWRGWLVPAYALSGLALSIVVHETGHVVFGLYSGFRLNFISFGPLHIRPPFRVSIDKRPQKGAYGLTSLIPIKTDKLRLRSMAFIAGGPFTNILSAIIVLYAAAPYFPFAAWYVPVSLLIGVANLIPFQRMSSVSDGKRLWMLVRRGAQGERWIAMIRLGADLLNGISAESLPEDFILKAIAIRDNSLDTVKAHAIAYTARWSQGRDEEAAELLEVCLQYSGLSSTRLREALISDAAVFQARRRKRADLATQWLADLPVKTQIPGLSLRAEAAILEAHDDIPAALQKLDEVEKVVLSSDDPVQRSLSLKSVQRWKSQLHEKLAPSPQNASDKPASLS